MGTSNFYNHENGIFVLNNYSYDEVLEMEIERLLEDNSWVESAQEELKGYLPKDKESALVELAKDEISEESIYEEMAFYEEMTCQDLFVEGMGLDCELEREGMSLIRDDNNQFRARVYSKTNKLLAELSLKSGYYDGVQLIVETDPYELLSDNYDLFYNDRIEDYQDEFVESKLNEVYSEHNKTLFKVIKNFTTQI